MVTVKDNLSGSVYEIRPWKEGDKEGLGVAFGQFGYKFVCSYVSTEKIPDPDFAGGLAAIIGGFYFQYSVNVGYDPAPPRRFEHKMADVLRLQKNQHGYDRYEVSVQDPPVDHSHYDPEMIY